MGTPASRQFELAELKLLVDAVMIGRATFGRPWIFKEIRDYLDNTGAAPLTVDEIEEGVAVGFVEL